MSEYAEIINDKVARVLILDDAQSEEECQEFLSKVSSNLWVKTEEKAGIDYEYHKDIKKIARPRPFESWKYDEKSNSYLPPIPRPLAVVVGRVYVWSEELKLWVLEKLNRIDLK